MASSTVKWFNPAKGLRVHSANRRRQGRFRPHFGSREPAFPPSMRSKSSMRARCRRRASRSRARNPGGTNSVGDAGESTGMEGLSRRATAALTALGVEVLTDARAQGIDEERVDHSVGADQPGAADHHAPAQSGLSCRCRSCRHRQEGVFAHAAAQFCQLHWRFSDAGRRRTPQCSVAAGIRKPSHKRTHRAPRSRASILLVAYF